MIDFKPIELQDRATIESYTLKSECRNCDMAFANIFCWREFHKSCWAIVDGFLVIRFLIDGKQRVGYMQPIGDGDFYPILERLEQDARLNFGQPLRMYGLCREGRATITNSGCRYFAFDDDRSLSDYIYLSEELRTLPGRKFQPKRNHVNRFTSKYSYRFEPLERVHFDDCLALEMQWCAEHKESSSEESMLNEQRAIREAFDNFEDLGLRGGVLYVEDKLVAFTYGSAINYDTFDCHIEKADTAYEGVFATINRLFADQIADHFTYINREEDMGIEGLRRAKLSYYPTILWPKTSALKLNREELQVKELWQEAFGDSDVFIDSFIIRHYQRDNMLSIEQDGRLISMLHIVEFNCNKLKVAYIYGVATLKERRGEGLGSTLIREAIERCKGEGFDVIALIPSSESLRSYYSRFGFCGEYPIELSSPDGFDFGTGSKEGDVAMIITLTESDFGKSGQSILNKKEG